jgi:hypothetical protein
MLMLHAGLDLSRRRLDVCLIGDEGDVVERLAAPPDADGLRHLVERVGPQGRVRGVIESMTGARFVRDTLEELGWEVLVADAQKVKGLAPLACKTDRIDAQVLAVLSHRDLVPAIWLPDPRVRAEREQARFRLHLVKENGPTEWAVFDAVMPTMTAIAEVAPRWPKRSADQISAGKTRYVNGRSRRNASSLTPAIATNRTAASRERPCDQPGCGGLDHAIARGTTTMAPAKSPSHHVRDTSASSPLVITPPSRSDSGPIMALTAVPAASATSNLPSPPTLSRGEPWRRRRRMSTAARSTSSMFPHVCPSAEPSGSAA